MNDVVDTEVITHHRFLESWLRGNVDRGALGEFTALHTSGFTYCGPGGSVTARDDLMATLARAHGTDPNATVLIRSIRVVASDTAHVVATYEEHHDRAASLSARISTAVFVREPSARHGLLWHHLHETWAAGT